MKTKYSLNQKNYGICNSIDPIKKFNDFEYEIFYNGLTKKRTIHIWDDIDQKTELIVTSALERLCLENEKVKLPVKIKINTFGGNAFSAFSIVSAMESAIKKGYEIETYGYSTVMSAGTIILASGTRRYCQPTTRFLIHDVGAFFMSNVTSESLRRETVEFDEILNMYEEILLSKTKISKEVFRDNVSRMNDWSFWGKNAVDMELVDDLF